MIIEERPGKHNVSDWFALQSQKLLNDQKNSWETLRNNYENLSLVKNRSFDFNGVEIVVQYNPARKRSSCADVSKQAIENRECFLCIDKLPKEQNGLLYGKNFVILCNPYPIFPEHFTISKKKHIPQAIIGNFEELLEVSRDLGKYYSVFYNGPKCGASAPDHMHFQAGTENLIPVEYQYEILKNGFTKNLYVDGKDKIEIRFFENLNRNFICFESGSKGELLYAFKIFIKAYKNISVPKEEPMMNIISTYKNNKWKIFIFPRTAHRPKEFFYNNKGKIIISPAAIDMGGLIITPREKDLENLTIENITSIYRQVSINKEYFEFLKKKMGEIYKRAD